ncbi:MAG: hypothetical protein QOE01_1769 [Actinomycetota bacterium]|jgi:hypothetical protein|nr:hypothetical protein [Actinomycetota bacterium]
MKFTQIIEFKTQHIERFNARLDDWIARSEGRRVPHHAVLRQDRDAADVFLLMVEFASHDLGMENASRPETGEFAAFLTSISDGQPTFRNLDVLREPDL